MGVNSFINRMPFGVPGAIARPTAPLNVESLPYGASAFPSYGVFGKLSGNTFVPVSAVGDTSPYGLLVRPYPTTGANASDPLGTSVPPTSGIASVLRKGYMMVKNNAGVPALGGTVYIRYANGAVGTPVGGIEAAAVGGSTVAIVGAQFMGPADANGNVEISFNAANQ